MVSFAAAATSPMFSKTIKKSVVSAPAQKLLASKKNTTRTDMILLEVDKAALSAVLKTWPENPEDSKVLKTFKIAVGKSEGDKQFEGDKKTPEGVYFTQTHIPGKSLPKKYGSIAIPIDFPNPIDRVQKKTGYGIWLHGVDREGRIEEAKVTEGCVAFHNKDVSSIASWLRPFQGVVVISDTSDAINRPDDLKTVRDLTENWIKAWAERDVDKYITYYHPDFRYKHHNRDSYAAFKKRIFNSYKKMVVNLSNLRVVTHAKYAVTMFNQDFHGDSHFSSIGRKKLYWIKNEQGQWQIMNELFEERRFEFVTFTDKELALLSGATSSISTDKPKSASSL